MLYLFHISKFIFQDLHLSCGYQVILEILGLLGNIRTYNGCPACKGKRHGAWGLIRIIS
jgi:hypothetical protein